MRIIRFYSIVAYTAPLNVFQHKRLKFQNVFPCFGVCSPLDVVGLKAWDVKLQLVYRHWPTCTNVPHFRTHIPILGVHGAPKF